MVATSACCSLFAVMIAESGCCKCVFVVVTGGEEEALAAYEEAVQAIFGLQLDRYSHFQPHRNPETGKLWWECIAMWPMQVMFGLKCTATPITEHAFERAPGLDLLTVALKASRIRI